MGSQGCLDHFPDLITLVHFFLLSESIHVVLLAHVLQSINHWLHGIVLIACGLQKLLLNSLLGKLVHVVGVSVGLCLHFCHVEDEF